MPKHTVGLLLIVLGACGLGACGVSVPDAWAPFVPTEGLLGAFGEKTEGKTSSVVLHYERKSIGGDALRGKFTERVGTQGFVSVSECVSPNGTSSALYVSDTKEVFQVAISLLGDEFYDVQLERAEGLPGVALANPDTCTWTAAADTVCTFGPPERCTFQ